MISMFRLRDRIEGRQSNTVGMKRPGSAAVPRPRAAPVIGRVRPRPQWAALCWALLLLGAGPPDLARDAVPPPSPHRPAPDGHVLFTDDFSSDSLHAWSFDRDGVWSIRHGMLRGELPDLHQERSLISIDGSHWRDLRVDLDICGMRGVDKGVVIRAAKNQGIAVDLRGPGYDDVLLHRGRHKLGSAPIVNPNGQWNHVRIEAAGPRYRVFVNDRLLIDDEDHGHMSAGRVSLPAYTGGVGKCTVYYDNVVVTAIDSTAEGSR